MKIKKILIILSFFILSGCGYEPIYSKKNLGNEFNFSINRIEFSGEGIVNQNLKDNLKNFINIKSRTVKYDLNVNSSKIITTTSKNKKGNPEIFYMKIIIDLEVFQDDKLKNKKTFEDGFEYKNKSNKFQLRQYEESIIKHVVTKISNDIVDQLYSLK